MRRASLAALLAAFVLPAAAAAQATIITDSTAEFRVVARGGDLSLPPFGETTVRQLFRLYEGEQATISFDLQRHSAQAGMVEHVKNALVVWTSTDTTAIQVFSNGWNRAQVVAQVGADGKSARVHVTIVLPGVIAQPGDAFPLVYTYLAPSLYQCMRLVVPPFSVAAGRSLYYEGPDFDDQKKGLDGCVSFEAPQPPPPPADTVSYPRELTLQLQLFQAGVFGLSVTLTEDGIPVRDVPVSVEVLGGKGWHIYGNPPDTRVEIRTRQTDELGRITPGDLEPETEVRITAEGARPVTIRAPGG